MQRVPNYTNVTIDSGAVLTADAWDGTQSGVLFFRATGTVSNSGSISMNAKGYRGGASTTGASAGLGGESFVRIQEVWTRAINGVCGGGAGGGISMELLARFYNRRRWWCWRPWRWRPICTGGGGGGGGYGSAGDAGDGSNAGYAGGRDKVVMGNLERKPGRGAGGGGGGTFGTVTFLNFI